MKAIDLKPTDLLAVVVPLESTEHEIMRIRNAIGYKCDSENCDWIALPKGKWQILGTCTADHIDFDVEANEYLTEYFKENYFPYGFTKCNEDCFRSLLSSNGLTDYEKLLIIKPLK